MFNPDLTDETILKLLQFNAKASNKEIANQLGLTPTPVYERIKRMERIGVIDCYVAKVNRLKLGYSLMAICQITLIDHSFDALKKFESETAAIDEILECFHMAGHYDYFLKIVTKDMDCFKDFLERKMSTIDNVGQIHTSFLLSEIKHTTAIPIMPK